MDCRRLFTVFAFTCVPTAAAGQGPAPEDLMGCYDLRFGRWDPEPTARFDTLRHLPPPRIQLDTFHVESGNPRSHSRVIRPAPGSRPSRHRFSGWTMVGDSVQMGWSTGFLGLRMVVALRGGDLVGYAQTFSDAYVEGDRDFRAEVRAVRVPCSAPPEHPESASRLVMRSVSLASGQELALGGPPPDSSLIQRWASDRTLVLRGTTHGVFEGAEEIRVELSRTGLVQEIRLRFPEGANIGSLRRRLEEAMGPAHFPYPENGLIRAGWEDVTTSLTLAAYDGRVEVLISDPRLF